jgi:hypothetical protein
MTTSFDDWSSEGLLRPLAACREAFEDLLAAIDRDIADAALPGLSIGVRDHGRQPHRAALRRLQVVGVVARAVEDRMGDGDGLGRNGDGVALSPTPVIEPIFGGADPRKASVAAPTFSWVPLVNPAQDWLAYPHVQA